jgi:hypothetical protein
MGEGPGRFDHGVAPIRRCVYVGQHDDARARPPDSRSTTHTRRIERDGYTVIEDFLTAGDLVEVRARARLFYLVHAQRTERLRRGAHGAGLHARRAREGVLEDRFSTPA